MSDAKTPDPAPGGTGSVKLRILTATYVNGELRRPDDVIELDATAAAELVGTGAADDNPGAIAYALSLVQ